MHGTVSGDAPIDARVKVIVWGPGRLGGFVLRVCFNGPMNSMSSEYSRSPQKKAAATLGSWWACLAQGVDGHT